MFQKSDFRCMRTEPSYEETRIILATTEAQITISGLLLRFTRVLQVITIFPICPKQMLG
jgi:hypothetical protein